MPNVKIDYVVSFSSEDPEHPANNLLSADVKSKWLCSKGEPSCSVVLQLKSACKIDSITIGAYHVALIEVLVGLSERPNDPFQVLVPSCVLLSPPASRRGDSVECVRSFAASQLAQAARAQRWDRVRVVCSQPYNKHCKYGLAFVHISSGEAQGSAAPAPAPAARPLRLQLDAEAGSSDDEFRPGELFAQYRRDELHSTSTDAQIKQASSHALKNIADTSTKITKTPISKTSRSPEQRADRDKRNPEQRADHDKRNSEQRADHDKRNSEQRADHDKRNSEQRADHDKRNSEQRADHDKRNSEQRADHDKRNSEQRADHDKRNSEQRADHDKRNPEQRADRDKRNPEQRADRDKRNSEQRADHDKRNSEQRADHDKRNSEQRADHDKRNPEQRADRDKRNPEQRADRDKRNPEQRADRDKRNPEQRADRDKRSLLYTDDDDRPHAKIDRVLQRHRDERDEADAEQARPSARSADTHSDKNKGNNHSDTFNSSKTVHSDEDSKVKHRNKNKTPHKNSERNLNTESATGSQQKGKRPSASDPELGPVCAAPGAVLAGAVVAMSGYENPRRAALRAAALELGAHYLRDWEPRCTHLVCAFPNTPKLRAVRASRARTVAVLGEWLEECRRRRRRLPWRWFATDPQQRQPVPEDFDAPGPAADSEGDTDDEIEKVLRQQEKKQRRDPTPDRPSDSGCDQIDGDGCKANGSVIPDSSRSPSSCDSSKLDAKEATAMDAEKATAMDAEEATAMDVEEATAMDASHDSDVTFVRDERVRAHISLHSDSDDTDEDEPPDRADSDEITKELPSLWSGSTFALSAALPPRRAALLARYIRAYGGLVLQESEVLEDSDVQYVVAAGGAAGAGGAGGARRVRPQWVWRQHASRGLRSSATT